MEWVFWFAAGWVASSVCLLAISVCFRRKLEDPTKPGGPDYYGL